jgi:Mg-chelatase subunit ChlD
MGFAFAIPWFLLLAIPLAYVIYTARKRRNVIGHPQMNIHRNLRRLPVVGYIRNASLIGLAVAMTIAMAQPQVQHLLDYTFRQAADFIILVDKSGSMSDALKVPEQVTFAGSNPQPAATDTTSGATPASPSTPPTSTKAQAAEAGIRMFIAQRVGDRLALMLFDTTAYYAWPFTFDSNLINQKLFLVEKSDGGTDFIAGITGAIQLFKDDGQSDGRVLIMVTDGEDSINDQAFDKLVTQLKDMHIRLYVLGVGDAWTSGDKKTDLARLADAVGGMVIMVGNTQQMHDGFVKINQTEKSLLKTQHSAENQDIYPPFLWAALVFLIIYLGASALIPDEQ